MAYDLTKTQEEWARHRDNLLIVRARVTPATARRLTRLAETRCEVDHGDSIGAAAWVRGYIRGRDLRLGRP
jgi:hypothetical protein